MTFENIASVITLLGIGGLLGTYFRILWERKNAALIQKQEFKEVRYKCIIILLLSYLDFDKNKPMLHKHGREYIQNKQDLKDDIVMELNNMILFASEEVLIAVQQFIEGPSQQCFYEVAVAMRKDLWGGKISIDKLNKTNIR